MIRRRGITTDGLIRACDLDDSYSIRLTMNRPNGRTTPLVEIGGPWISDIGARGIMSASSDS